MSGWLDFGQQQQGLCAKHSVSERRKMCLRMRDGQRSSGLLVPSRLKTIAGQNQLFRVYAKVKKNMSIG